MGRTTVLIGPNGAGKSNLLAFLKMVPMMESQSLRLFIGRSGAAESNLHYGPKRTPVMSFRIDAEQDDGAASAYAVRLGHASGDSLVFVEESALARKSGQDPWETTSLGVGHVESNLKPYSKNTAFWPASVVRHWVSRMNFYHFHDTSMESPLRGHGRQEESDYLRSDGRNWRRSFTRWRTARARPTELPSIASRDPPADRTFREVSRACAHGAE